MEKYKKELEYSYTFGVFPTIELIKNQPNKVQAILLSSKFKQSEETEKYFAPYAQKGMVQINDKLVNKLADKENTFVIGVFKKYTCKCLPKGNQVVLVNPSDMGNLGTIMRTMLGFKITNLVLITPCADVFNPKTIRASMGAIFSLNIASYASFEEYAKQHSEHKKYLFMLNGKSVLGKFEPPENNYALVFGNESSGLPPYVEDFGQSVVISHSHQIDSLNLPMSVGISLYEFTKNHIF